MNWFEALLLGIIQGISEFLPISSSAHLVLAEKILGINVNTNSLSFEVFLHLASLLAVICFFYREIIVITKDFFSYLFFKKKEALIHFRFSCFIICTTLVTMIVGKGIEELLEERITSAATIGAALIITGIFLIFIEHGIKIGERTERKMTLRDAIIVGLAQALAVIPGISRAGSTLIAALWCGLAKETAVRYSFLLSIPIILGVTIIKLPELMNEASSGGLQSELAIAFTASFFFAIIGIKWLIQMLNKAKLSYFAIYCIALGIITWVYLQDTFLKI